MYGITRGEIVFCLVRCAILHTSPDNLWSSYHSCFRHTNFRMNVLQDFLVLPVTFFSSSFISCFHTPFLFFLIIIHYSLNLQPSSDLGFWFLLYVFLPFSTFRLEISHDMITCASIVGDCSHKLILPPRKILWYRNHNILCSQLIHIV